MSAAAWLAALALLTRLAPSAAEDDGGPPVLAYLFTLRRARHPLPHTWTKYFSGCAPGSYKIHIHVDPTFNGTSASESGPAARYFRQSHVLPRDQLGKVRRFGHELVRARLRLLRHALGSGNGPQRPLWYSFFSESCAPIAPCEQVHKHLADPAAAGRSFIDNQRPLHPEQVAGSATWAREFASVCPKCSAAGIAPANFRYSPGWVTLWHAHAAELTEKESQYDDAFANWGWSKMVNGIPDETYWSTLANLHGHPITGALTTYMEPGDPKTGHSKMFTEVDVARLWAQPAPSFFARKFPTTPRVDATLLARLVKAMGGASGGSGGGSGGKGHGKSSGASSERQQRRRKTE